MENRNYKKYEISEDLNARIVAEIAKAKAITKAKDYEIAEKLGKTKQGYSAMIVNGLSKLGNIEAIANALGYEIELTFVKKN